MFKKTITYISFDARIKVRLQNSISFRISKLEKTEMGTAEIYPLVQGRASRLRSEWMSGKISLFCQEKKGRPEASGQIRACLEVGFAGGKHHFFDKTRRFLKCISAEPRRIKKERCVIEKVLFCSPKVDLQTCSQKYNSKIMTRQINRIPSVQSFFGDKPELPPK